MGFDERAKIMILAQEVCKVLGEHLVAQWKNIQRFQRAFSIMALELVLLQ